MGDQGPQGAVEGQEGWSHKCAGWATQEPGHRPAEGSSPANFLRKRNTQTVAGPVGEGSPRPSGGQDGGRPQDRPLARGTQRTLLGS